MNIKGSYKASCIAIALALGGTILAAPSVMAAEAKAGKAEYSKPFIAVAGPLQAAITALKGKAPDAATLEGFKQKTDGLVAAVSTADDKLAAGQLLVNIGGMAKDEAMQRKGVTLMLASGKAPADLAPKLHLYAGQFAMNAKEYPVAITELQAAVAGNPTNYDAGALLADALIKGGQPAQGLTQLKTTIDKMKAAGTVVPESWYRSGLGGAYRGKMLDQAYAFAADLAAAYPTKQNWAASIATVRDLARYAAPEELDLMRLMVRTNSFSEKGEYLDIISSADPRKLPGEVLAVIDSGYAGGLITPKDSFIADQRTLAAETAARDKPRLPAYDKASRLPTATGAEIMGNADAFLSYGQPATAIELYQIALGKPGIDLARANTRIGIALLDKGDFAGAQASFAKVDGARKPMARLWSIYAAQKAAGK